MEFEDLHIDDEVVFVTTELFGHKITLLNGRIVTLFPEERAVGLLTYVGYFSVPETEMHRLVRGYKLEFLSE